MTKKSFLIVALSILSVCLLFVGVMTILKWDFTKLSTDRFVTNSYGFGEPFTHVRVVTDTADVAVLPAEDRVTAVDCYELEKAKHKVTIKDNTLMVEIEDTRKWYEHIGIHFKTPTVRVYLPAGVYSGLSVEGSTGDVEIAPDFRFTNMQVSLSTGNVTNRATVTENMDIGTSTGNICAEKVTAAEMNLTVTTGEVSLSSVDCSGTLSVLVSTGNATLNTVRCKNLTTDGDTGSLVLADVIATEAFKIKRSTGDVHLDRCDASTMEIVTDTGDVSGSLLSEKVFITQTDAGRIHVPKSVTGGKCEITTDTGDISISIP